MTRHTILMTDKPTCEYFLLCTNPADGLYHHPVMPNPVPACNRCVTRMGLDASPKWKPFTN